MSSERIALADAVANLREQLQIAIDEGEGKKLRFEIQEMELEFNCTVSREVEGNAGVKFWVIEAGAGGKIGDETTQTVRLKLKPTDSTGGPIELSDRDKVR